MNTGTESENIVLKDKKATKIYETIGINQSTYSKIEKNKYKLDIETLKKIAGVLEVDLIKLM
jgi:transcriptional regulator with XRE-family HTH domain